MRKVGLENLILKGDIESKREKRKYRVTYPTSLCKWMAGKRLRRIGSSIMNGHSK